MDDSIQFAQYAQIFQNDKDISYFAIKSVVSGMHNIYGWANNTILPAIWLVDCFYKKKMYRIRCDPNRLLPHWQTIYFENRHNIPIHM